MLKLTPREVNPEEVANALPIGGVPLLLDDKLLATADPLAPPIPIFRKLGVLVLNSDYTVAEPMRASGLGEAVKNLLRERGA